MIPDFEAVALLDTDVLVLRDLEGLFAAFRARGPDAVFGLAVEVLSALKKLGVEQSDGCKRSLRQFRNVEMLLSGKKENRGAADVHPLPGERLLLRIAGGQRRGPHGGPRPLPRALRGDLRAREG